MDQPQTVSHETIYQAIYVLPKGELRRDLIGLLRQGRKLRRPRSQGKDRRGAVHEWQQCGSCGAAFDKVTEVRKGP